MAEVYSLLERARGNLLHVASHKRIDLRRALGHARLLDTLLAVLEVAEDEDMVEEEEALIDCDPEDWNDSDSDSEDSDSDAEWDADTTSVLESGSESGSESESDPDSELPTSEDFNEDFLADCHGKYCDSSTSHPASEHNEGYWGP
jgi:hypothetical protein